jgi:hypothetical protein
VERRGKERGMESVEYFIAWLEAKEKDNYY